ncbi:hypothetical protein PG985_008060 [Apiospora marii]|uniref:uncharacterized protein n=1 Tax=Apiospora marii TaxID=335849 RepID=UPI00312DF469
MQYPSLPTALLLSLLAAGTQAIPTTNGPQAQPPQALLLPRAVSPDLEKRGGIEPSTAYPQNFLYQKYNCGAGRVHLDPDELYDAQRALQDATSGATHLPDGKRCFVARCGDVIAFFCGKEPGAFLTTPPGSLAQVWEGVSRECGSYQAGLVGSGNGVYYSAGYISASQADELENDIPELRLA